jgi:prepilin-type N-terminal cleavage/methylation domain-containing protein
MYGKWLASRRRTNVTAKVPDTRGFTLIELLIVIVVLGILAAVVIFSLGGITAQAASAACNANAKTVAIAVSAYEAQNGAAPANYSDLTAGSNPYLQAVPSSPYYSITLSDGTVMVAAPTSATPIDYSSANACAGANASGSTPTTTSTSPIPTSTTTSTSTTTTTTSTTTTTAPSNGVRVSASDDNSNTYSGTDTLTFSNTSSVTSMSVTIRVVQTAGLTGPNLWNDFPGDMSEGVSTSGGVFTYTYTLTGPLPANSNVYVTAQWAGNGTAHPVSGDTYSVVSSSGGVASTLTGSF